MGIDIQYAEIIITCIFVYSFSISTILYNKKWRWLVFSWSARSLSISASISSNGAVPSTAKGRMVVDIPLDNIRRPLMRTRANDQQKVKELMDSISEIGLQVPIDVLEVDGVYYGFSGCHRYEAHQKLGLPTIRCKVRRGTKETLRHHLR
ncbi:unnamed protein product [Rhodiola kirilowii]